MWLVQISEASKLGLEWPGWVADIDCIVWLLIFFLEEPGCCNLKVCWHFHQIFSTYSFFMGKLKQSKHLQVNQALLGANCCEEVGWNGSGRWFWTVLWISTMRNRMIPGKKSSMISIEKDHPRIWYKKKTHKGFSTLPVKNGLVWFVGGKKEGPGGAR